MLWQTCESPFRLSRGEGDGVADQAMKFYRSGVYLIEVQVAIHKVKLSERS